MTTKYEMFKELIEQSQAERRGLTVFINGQTLVGIVVKIDGAESIEMTSQTFRRIIVRVEAIDAIAVV